MAHEAEGAGPGSDSPHPAITITLTSAEAAALHAAGDAQDNDLQNLFYLRLIGQGISKTEAETSAQNLAERAIAVRQKIRAAIRYEIHIIDSDS